MRIGYKSQDEGFEVKTPNDSCGRSFLVLVSHFFEIHEEKDTSGA